MKFRASKLLRVDIWEDEEKEELEEEKFSEDEIMNTYEGMALKIEETEEETEIDENQNNNVDEYERHCMALQPGLSFNEETDFNDPDNFIESYLRVGLLSGEKTSDTRLDEYADTEDDQLMDKVCREATNEERGTNEPSSALGSVTGYSAKKCLEGSMNSCSCACCFKVYNTEMTDRMQVESNKQCDEKKEDPGGN